MEYFLGREKLEKRLNKGTKTKRYSPALLESLILTKYLAEKGDLPPANNEL